MIIHKKTNNSNKIQTKTHKVTIRMDEKELKKIKEVARAENKSISNIIRNRILHTKQAKEENIIKINNANTISKINTLRILIEELIRETENKIEIYKKIGSQISRVAGNINQIAHRLNLENILEKEREKEETAFKKTRASNISTENKEQSIIKTMAMEDFKKEAKETKEIFNKMKQEFDNKTKYAYFEKVKEYNTLLKELNKLEIVIKG